MICQLWVSLLLVTAPRHEAVQDSALSVDSILPIVITAMENDARSSFPDLNFGPLALDVGKIARLFKAIQKTRIDSALLSRQLGRGFLNVHQRGYSMGIDSALHMIYVTIDTVAKTPGKIRLVGWAAMRVPGLSPKEIVGAVHEWIFEFVAEGKRWIFTAQRMRTVIG